MYNKKGDHSYEATGIFKRGISVVRNFHCCASCIHFEATKDDELNKMKTRCTRLQYETKPHYQFSCWHPKPEVQKLMKKEGLNWEV
jgi:hypothetical protein